MTNIFTVAGIIIPLWALLTASLLVPFIITYISIPTIVTVSSLKKLFDVPNERTSHNATIPVLGGLSIFSSFTVSAVIFSLPGESGEIKYIIGAIIILFFAGLKDDILIIDPKKKLFSQILAASVIVILGDIRIISFHNVFGIGDISYIPSVLFSAFLIITLINGFNLIDGVDGLASGIGILISLFFAIWFFLAGSYTYTVLCLSLIGTLAAFFIFNVFGKTNKIFMGDTGAMITGMIIAIFTIRFLEFESETVSHLQFSNAPALAFGLLIVPLFDTLRVFILRIRNGKSPFKADKNHVHHNLLRLGFSHIQVTSLIIIINLVFVFIVFSLRQLGSVLLIIITLLIATALSFWLDMAVKKKNKITAENNSAI